MKLILAFVFAIAFAHTACAAYDLRIHIYGDRSCGQYIKALANNAPLSQKTTDQAIEDNAITNWLSGAVTGMNIADAHNEISMRDVLSNSDLLSLKQWVKIFCEKYPLRSIGSGVEIFYIGRQSGQIP